MTRIALVALHDNAAQELVVRHHDKTTDQEIFEGAMSTYTPHRIKRITICQVDVVFENSTTLEIAIDTARKLTA